MGGRVSGVKPIMLGHGTTQNLRLPVGSVSMSWSFAVPMMT